MSERPNVVLAALIAVTITIAGGLAVGLVAVGGCSISDLPSLLVAAFSACFFFVAHMHRVPVSWLVLAGLLLVSLLSFLRVVLAAWRTQRVLRALPVAPITRGPLAEIAAASATRLYALPARRPSAFCAGLMRPRVILTTGLLDALAADEQAAAVWHEAHHASRREPLKVFVGRLAASTFFWVPMLKDLLERYLLAKELVADRVAVGNAGLLALAGALSAAAPAPAGTLGLADRVSPRLERLVDPQAKLPPLFRPSRLVATAFALLSLLLALALPWTVDVDPAHLRTLLDF